MSITRRVFFNRWSKVQRQKYSRKSQMRVSVRFRGAIRHEASSRQHSPRGEHSDDRVPRCDSQQCRPRDRRRSGTCVTVIEFQPSPLEPQLGPLPTPRCRRVTVRLVATGRLRKVVASPVSAGRLGLCRPASSFSEGPLLAESFPFEAKKKNRAVVLTMISAKKKVIIDTDPGIDDAMAILLAFNCPELDVIGLTTTFGNVRTTMATFNALHLCDVAGRDDVPVSQGLVTTLLGQHKNQIADFVHGKDGLGDTNPAPPKRKAIEQGAPEFLIEKVKEFPGEITVVALGPLTNLAKAVKDDPEFAKNVGQIVVLGGAFSVNGNVNPAAEANILGDPEAADIVFICGADILVIGINITHQVFLTAAQMEEVGRSNGKFGKYLYETAKFYFDYHRAAYDIDGIYLHDPTTVMAAVNPSLLTYEEGVIRVQTEGVCRGMTVFCDTLKRWASPTEWCNKPRVKVAVTVDADKMATEIKDRLSA